MKQILTITFLFVICFVHAQELPSKPANAFAFPMGSKFVIKLIPTDSVSFDYSVIAFEQFHETVDAWKNHDELFEEKGEENTIVFYFCFGTHGETDEEKGKNMQSLLLMKNYSKVALNYTSEIQRQKDGQFEATSNIGIFPNIWGMEMWPYPIYTIGLKEFRKSNK